MALPFLVHYPHGYQLTANTADAFAKVNYPL
jgi:hypothetical protein